jgi:glutathione S-transferase
MIELYTHPMSPCAQKVRIVLAEKSLPWKAHTVNLSEKENLKPEYLELNPLGVVPTLVHMGKPVIESSIICEYLNEQFPEINLSSDDAYLRSQMRFWMKHVDTKLHPACGALQWPLIMRPGMMCKPEEERNRLLAQIPEKPRRERQKRLVEMGLEAPDVVDAVKTYRSTILQMETVLKTQKWIVGNTFSLADICLAPYFQTLDQFDWNLMYEGCPEVKAWFQRCQARSSYQGAVSSDFSDELLSELKRKGENAWPVIADHLEKTALSDAS